MRVTRETTFVFGTNATSGIYRIMRYYALDGRTTLCNRALRRADWSWIYRMACTRTRTLAHVLAVKAAERALAKLSMQNYASRKWHRKRDFNWPIQNDWVKWYAVRGIRLSCAGSWMDAGCVKWRRLRWYFNRHVLALLWIPGKANANKFWIKLFGNYRLQYVRRYRTGFQHFFFF